MTTEVSSLVAGMRYLTSGKYDVYVVSPPLVPIVCAAPVVLLGRGDGKESLVDLLSLRPEYGMGMQLLERYGPAAMGVIRVLPARLPEIGLLGC